MFFLADVVWRGNQSTGHLSSELPLVGQPLDTIIIAQPPDYLMEVVGFNFAAALLRQSGTSSLKSEMLPVYWQQCVEKLMIGHAEPPYTSSTL